MSLKPWWTLCCPPFIVITVKHFQRRKAFPRSAAFKKKKKKQKSKPRRHLHTTETTTILLALWHITWSCGWNQVFLPFPSCTSPARRLLCPGTVSSLSIPCPSAITAQPAAGISAPRFSRQKSLGFRPRQSQRSCIKAVLKSVGFYYNPQWPFMHELISFLLLITEA